MTDIAQIGIFQVIQMKRATLITTITGAILLVSFLLLSPKPSLEPTPLTHLGQPAEFWFAKIPVTIVGAGARGYMNVLGQEKTKFGKLTVACLQQAGHRMELLLYVFQ